MKQRLFLAIVLVGAILLGACGPKPYYKTKEGKRKQKYYNAVQFGNPNVPKPKF